MRIFFSVGEPSGDLHASNLIRILRQEVPNLDTVGYGGPKMQAAGCELHFDLTQLAVMFIGAVLGNLRKFLGLIADADRYFASNQVDAVVLVDYPGLNWWIARKARKHNIPVFYYGVPQMWAWAPWRISKIRKFVDHVICKLPFEQKWFADRGCKAHYVGHPYFDQMVTQELDHEFVNSQSRTDHSSNPLVLLLPGSRKLELQRNLDILIDSANSIREKHPQARFAMGCYDQNHLEFVLPKCSDAGIEAYAGKTQELMTQSSACIACSGSVSLELLHHRIPTVVVYNIGLVKYIVQIFVLQCKFITLPNLMNAADIKKTKWLPFNPDAPNGEPVLMPEYLTWRNPAARVAQHIARWLGSAQELEQKKTELDQLASQYAKPGATRAAATYIIEQLHSDTNDISTVAA